MSEVDAGSEESERDRENWNGDWMAEFFEVMRPERDRYVIARRRGQKPWMERKFLSRGLIERQVNRGLMIAYFASARGRDYVAVDVDDHGGSDGKVGNEEGWADGRPTERLRRKVEEIVGRIGRAPSLAFASPRGVHLYWLMTRELPGAVVDGLMEKKVEGVGEHRPTERDALRVPNPEGFRNARLVAQAFVGFRGAQRYEPEELFGEAVAPGNVVVSVREQGVGRAEEQVSQAGPKTGKLAERATGSKKVEAEEAKVAELTDGQTNTVYRHLVGVYYANGVTKEEAVARLQALINRSPGYSGPLGDKLERRVESSYKNLKPMVKAVAAAWTRLREDPAAQAVVESIIDAVGLKAKSRRRGALEKILWGLWSRKLQNDWIVGSPDRLAAHEHKYPGYTRLMQRGYYPVSTKDLRAWVFRYTPYVEVLCKVGVMAPSGNKYKPGERCLYYALRINAFKVLRGNSIGPVGSLTVTRVG